VTIPSQFSRNEESQVNRVKGSSSACKNGVVGATLTTVIVSGAMYEIWGLLNGMQIFVHFPLLSVRVPPYSLLMIQEIVDIATMDVLDSFTFNKVSEDDVFLKVFGAPQNFTTRNNNFA
jgi:hypothetical protein